MSADEPAVVRLGHDIVRHLHHDSDEERAVEAATHIEKFWEPRMRAELIALVRAGDPRIEPELQAAARKLVRDDTDDTEIARPSGG